MPTLRKLSRKRFDVLGAEPESQEARNSMVASCRMVVGAVEVDRLHHPGARRQDIQAEELRAGLKDSHGIHLPGLWQQMGILILAE